MIRVDRLLIPWPQFIVKIVQLVTLFHTAVLAGAWSSKGIGFMDLDNGDYDVEPYFEYLITMCTFGMLWALVELALAVVKQDLPPILVLIINGVLGLLTLVAVGVFIGGTVSLSNTNLARALSLNLAALEAAGFFGMVAAMTYIGDLMLGGIEAYFKVKQKDIMALFLGSCCTN